MSNKVQATYHGAEENDKPTKVCPECASYSCIDCDGTVKSEGFGWDVCPCRCNPQAQP